MKKVIKSDGMITFVNEAFLGSVIEEGDTVEDIEKPSRPDPTNEEIAEQNLASLRNIRNNILAESDWMANSDVAMTDEWRVYRQALRDITDNYTSLEDVVWPDKPE
jgi:hypothetical protein